MRLLDLRLFYCGVCFCFFISFILIYLISKTKKYKKHLNLLTARVIIKYNIKNTLRGYC